MGMRYQERAVGGVKGLECLPVAVGAVIAAVLVAPLAILLAARPAQAQVYEGRIVPCNATAEVHDRLRHGYAERRVAVGLSPAQGEIVEVWLSSDGTMTVLATRADDVSCVLAVAESAGMTGAGQ